MLSINTLKYSVSEGQKTDNKKEVYSDEPGWEDSFATIIFTKAVLSHAEKTLSEQGIAHKLKQITRGVNEENKRIIMELYGLMSEEYTPQDLKYSKDMLGSLATKLYEGLQNCDAGFINRAIETYRGLKKTSSLEERLEKIRTVLVETTACSILRKVTDQNFMEVHNKNQVTIIASGIYGIQPTNPNDQYTGTLKTEYVQAQLKSDFQQKYTPMNILKLLEEEYLAELRNLGYVGKKTYNMGEYGAFTEHISKELPEEEPNKYLTSEDDGNIDINWVQVRTKLLEQLISQGFILGASAVEFFAANLTDLNDEEREYVMERILTLDQFKEKLQKEAIGSSCEREHPAIPWFLLACRNGNTHNAVDSLNAARDNSQLLQKMLLAGVPGKWPAYGFRRACQAGHTEIVKACINAAKDNPDLLQKMLLAGAPGGLPANGFFLACRESHTNIAEAYLQAADSNTLNCIFRARINNSSAKMFCSKIFGSNLDLIKKLDLKNRGIVISNLKYYYDKQGEKETPVAFSFINSSELDPSNNDLTLKTYIACASYLSWMRIRIYMCLYFDFFNKPNLIDEIKGRAQLKWHGASRQSMLFPQAEPKDSADGAFVP